MKTEIAIPADKASLSPAERKRRRELERIIDRGLKAWIKVSAALLEVRDSRLYRETHATFEDYARDRWGLARRTAYGYIEAAMVQANVSASAQLPTVQHARELAVLPAPDQRKLAAKVASLPVRAARRVVREHRRAETLNGALHEQAKQAQKGGAGTGDDYVDVYRTVVLIRARLRRVVETVQEAKASGAMPDEEQRGALLAVLQEMESLLEFGRSYLTEEV